MFIGLSHQQQNKWILLVRLLELDEGARVVLGVVRNVARQIRILRTLIGVRSLLDKRLDGCQMPFRFGYIAATNSNPGLRVFPSQLRQRAIRR